MQTDTQRGELQGDYWSHGLGSLGGTKKAGPLFTQTRDQAGATMGVIHFLAALAFSAPVWTGKKAEEGRGAVLVLKSEQGGIARDLPELAKPSSAHPFH